MALTKNSFPHNPRTMEALFQLADSKQEYCVQQLRSVVEIPSVSTQADKRKDVLQTCEVLRYAGLVLTQHRSFNITVVGLTLGPPQKVA